MTAPTASTVADAATFPGQQMARRPGAFTALRWELVKLASQARAPLTLLGCVVVPPLVVLVLKGQQNTPKDTLFGRHIHDSGYAVPLLLLGFLTQWALPLLASIVAGDIFAREDQLGTWKTVLTRSVSRTQVFWAKTLTAVGFALLALVLLGTSAIVSSVIIVGHQPLTGLTGQLIPSGTAATLVTASWATQLGPLIGFTGLAIVLSVWTRNPTVGVVAPLVLGFVMQLVGSIGGFALPRRFLLSTPMESWHGLLTQHRFYTPLTTGIAVFAGWFVICLIVAYVIVRRRDITGG